MKAFAETFNECVFLENLYIYIYIYTYMSKRKKYNTQVKYISKLKEGINKNNSRFCVYIYID